MIDPTAASGDRGPQRTARALAIQVVIVSYNRAADLRRCLESLARQEPPVAQVTVVDNGSADGTLEMVQRDYPWVDLIRSPSNPGPCIARNAAALETQEPVLWFLDSDAEVRDADGAARMHALFAADPDLGAVGGEAVLSTDGHVVGVKRLRLGANAVIQGDALNAEAPQVLDCNVIASCNLMIRRDDFLMLGGFDPFYFFFYEDMDLTWRLHQLGRRLAVLSPMPVVHHYSEAGRNKQLWLLGRNRMYFCLKNLSWRQLFLLPLADVCFMLRADNLRRLFRRARQPAVAVSAVTVQDATAPMDRGAIAVRAGSLALRMAVVITLGYLAIPAIVLPALAERRRDGRGAAALRAGGAAMLRPGAAAGTG